MATTILKHMKSSSGMNTSSHLQRTINYICNPEKTEGGIWIGSNISPDPNAVFREMMDTKGFYQKTSGRQGYHYVISFPPGEADEKTAYEIGKEFLEAYLGSDYEYIWAVHNDHDHLHIHMVFNSVRRTDGYKYRYNNGDWAKHIQPITDRLCKKYGLSELTYEHDKRTGKSYAEHMAAKEGKITHSMIIRADIDAAISQSESEEEFLQIMAEMGYQIREGKSMKHGPYYAYHAPGFERAKRDYNLGIGYRREDVVARIHATMDFTNTQQLPEINLPAAKGYLQTHYFRRAMQAANYRDYDRLVIDQRRVRRDLIHIDRLSQMCNLLIQQDLRTIDDVKKAFDHAKKDLNAAYRVRQTTNSVLENLTDEERDIQQTYKDLKRELILFDETDPEADAIKDRIQTLENEYSFLNKPDIENRIARLKNEKSLLNRIIKEAEDTSKIPEVQLKPHTVKEEKVEQHERRKYHH